MLTYMGFDIGGSRIKYGVVNSDWQVLHWDAENMNLDWSSDQFLEHICSLAKKMLCLAANEDMVVRSLGVGICGFVDYVEGVFLGDTKLPNLGQCKIKDYLEEYLGLPTLVDHDIRIFARNEMIVGQGRGVKDFCVITIGTGIGVCFVFDGMIYRRSTGGLGHTQVNRRKTDCCCVDAESCDQICHCGGHGCLESYAAIQGLASEAKRCFSCFPEKSMQLHGLSPERVVPQLVNWAKEGNETAIGVLKYAAEAIAQGVANVLHLLNPERIILAGGIIDIGDYIQKPLLVKLREYTYLEANLDRRVFFSKQTKHAGVVGAAILASEVCHD